MTKQKKWEIDLRHEHTITWEEIRWKRGKQFLVNKTGGHCKLHGKVRDLIFTSESGDCKTGSWKSREASIRSPV